MVKHLLMAILAIHVAGCSKDPGDEESEIQTPPPQSTESTRTNEVENGNGKLSSRARFLRDLDKIKVGMTHEEARKIMSSYMEGTGFPPVPARDGSPSGGILTDGTTGEGFETGATDAGELTLKGTIVFRHSNEPAFNADWGIVKFEDGKVVDVTFSPD